MVRSMKFLKIMSFASLVAFSVSCGEGNENNEKNNEKIDTVVEMETITEYSEDSTSKKEYQIDINTKNFLFSIVYFTNIK